MTHRDLDPMMGRAIAADGIGTVIASAVGGSPTTTYAENIGVMAATRVHSSVAYHLVRVIAPGRAPRRPFADGGRGSPPRATA
ncbi:MAG: solute carrier family 23 protein [Nocardioidaceae bacterium]